MNISMSLVPVEKAGMSTVLAVVLLGRLGMCWTVEMRSSRSSTSWRYLCMPWALQLHASQLQ
jgi:hypothetical protein